MFNTLYRCPRTIAPHENGPLAESRGVNLEHLAAQGNQAAHLMQHQVLPNDFGGLALQSQLFGNPASVTVVDFEAVNSACFLSVQRSRPKAAMTKAH